VYQWYAQANVVVMFQKPTTLTRPI
jgi:hypothetical protein